MLIGRLGTRGRNLELEDMTIEISQTEEQIGKTEKINRIEQSKTV